MKLELSDFLINFRNLKDMMENRLLKTQKLYSQAQISQHLSDMCNFNK